MYIDIDKHYRQHVNNKRGLPAMPAALKMGQIGSVFECKDLACTLDPYSLSY